MTRAERQKRAEQRSLFRMQSFRVEFPTLPPSTNNLYTNIHGRGRVLSSVARAWKDGAIPVIQNAMQRAEWDVPQGTPYSVSIDIRHPKALTFDLDGKLKLLLDALGTALGTDDRYLVAINACKARGAEELTLYVQSVPPVKAGDV